MSVLDMSVLDTSAAGLSIVVALDPSQWLVLAGGVLLIALILWYFFGEGDPS